MTSPKRFTLPRRKKLKLSPGDHISRLVSKIDAVKSDHRSLVLVTHGFFELLIEALVKAKCKNPERIASDSRTYSHSAKLVILHEAGVISDQRFAVLDWFRDLRNGAAHEPFFEVTAGDLKYFSDARLRRPDNFYHVCLSLLIEFWNEHLPIFLPMFGKEDGDEKS